METIYRVAVTFDLLISNIIEIFFVPWIVHLCDMVTLGVNVIEAGTILLF
jgi:hypothetical protein